MRNPEARSRSSSSRSRGSNREASRCRPNAACASWARATGRASFTSDLSVNGFALCHQLGLKPLSQVMGSSIYQMGYQSSWGNMGYGGAMLFELDTLSEALNEVRGRALVRLGEEARHVGADAVVGVQTRAGESQLDTGATRARAHGRGHGGAPRGRARRAPGPDRAVGRRVRDARARRLRAAGDRRVERGVLHELCLRRHDGGRLAAPFTMGVQNFELREFTQAIYSAREAVMQRISGQAAALGASGVVGMNIGHTVRPQTLGGGVGMREIRGLMVTFTAVGTAIREDADTTVEAPKPVVDLYT